MNAVGTNLYDSLENCIYMQILEEFKMLDKYKVLERTIRLDGKDPYIDLNSLDACDTTT